MTLITGKIRITNTVRIGSETSGILFDMDASNASSVTLTGSLVDRVDDSSNNGSGRFFTDGITKPTYLLAEQNGLNVMDFTPSQTNYLTMTSTFTIKHLFAVAKLTGISSDFDGLFTTGSVVNDLVLIIDATTGTRLATSATYGDLTTFRENLALVPTGNITVGAWAVWSISSTTSGMQASEWIIGHDREFANRNWTGHIAQVIGYSNVLNATLRDDIIQGLMDKWGIV